MHGLSLQLLRIKIYQTKRQNESSLRVYSPLTNGQEWVSNHYTPPYSLHLFFCFLNFGCDVFLFVPIFYYLKLRCANVIHTGDVGHLQKNASFSFLHIAPVFMTLCHKVAILNQYIMVSTKTRR